MAGKITYAQNNKDLMALNSIKVKIQNGGGWSLRCGLSIVLN